MIIRYQLYVGGYLNIIVNRNTTGRHHQATIHYNDMAANLHLMGTNDSKRGIHTTAFPHIWKKTMKQPIIFVRHRHSMVQAEYQLCLFFR